jgi:hypothetical protein
MNPTYGRSDEHLARQKLLGSHSGLQMLGLWAIRKLTTESV